MFNRLQIDLPFIKKFRGLKPEAGTDSQSDQCDPMQYYGEVLHLISYGMFGFKT
jgi:hypothetical protein